jgi:hypothetical protein
MEKPSGWNNRHPPLAEKTDIVYGFNIETRFLSEMRRIVARYPPWKTR